MAINTFIRLLNGAPTADQVFDPANIPTQDETNALVGTAGSPSGANPYLTENDPRIPSADESDALDGIVGFPPSGADLFATVGYVDQQIGAISAGLFWLDAVDHNINYVKTDTGAPSGTPDTGDKLLNTADNTLYQESGGSWDAGTAVTSGQRFIWKNEGVGTGVIGGNTTGTADDDVRQFNGSTFDITSPVDGSTVCVLDEDRKYTFNGTNWVVLESITQHNDYAGLQGGTSTERFHITQDQDAGLAASAVALDGTNVVLDNLSKYKGTCVYHFAFRGGTSVGSQTIDMFEASGSSQEIEMPANGTIIGVAIGVNNPVSASGFCQVRPLINGATQLFPAANLTFGETENTDIDDSGTFSQGNTLGLEFNTDSNWNASDATLDIMGQVHVVFNS